MTVTASPTVITATGSDVRRVLIHCWGVPSLIATGALCTSVGASLRRLPQLRIPPLLLKRAGGEPNSNQPATAYGGT